MLIDSIKKIFSLAKSDFRKRFVGSFFGIIWMFVQPLCTVLIYTLIFQVGFKATPTIPGVPYVVFILTGLVPWFYFQESILSITNCLSEYNYLVKKVVFDVTSLPIIKLISCLFAHICFIVIMMIALFVAKIPFRASYLLIIYFSFCTSLLALGIGYLTSSINVFFRDMYQIVVILLQFGIWLAPIMYDETIFGERAKIVTILLKFNPFYYIVKGYRMCLLNDSFTIFLKETIYFWTVSILVFVLGYVTYDRLKDHFSDVL